MSKAKQLLEKYYHIYEEAVDPEVADLTKKLDAAFKKLIDNAKYTVVSGEKYNVKSPVVEFQVPIITIERGQDTRKNPGDAHNSSAAFSKIFDQIWGLRDKGWMVTQPRGISGTGWEDKNSQTSGTTMGFAIGKMPQ